MAKTYFQLIGIAYIDLFLSVCPIYSSMLGKIQKIICYCKEYLENFGVWWVQIKFEYSGKGSANGLVFQVRATDPDPFHSTLNCLLDAYKDKMKFRFRFFRDKLYFIFKLLGCPNWCLSLCIFSCCPHIHGLFDM